MSRSLVTNLLNEGTGASASESPEASSRDQDGRMFGVFVPGHVLLRFKLAVFVFVVAVVGGIVGGMAILFLLFLL